METPDERNERKRKEIQKDLEKQWLQRPKNEG